MNQSKKSPNNVSYYMRILAGGYLLYIDYTLLKGWQRLDNKILFGIFMFVFAAIAVPLIAYSIIAILKNNKTQNQDISEQLEGDKDTERKSEQDMTENQQTEHELAEKEQDEDKL